MGCWKRPEQQSRLEPKDRPMAVPATAWDPRADWRSAAVAEPAGRRCPPAIRTSLAEPARAWPRCRASGPGASAALANSSDGNWFPQRSRPPQGTRPGVSLPENANLLDPSCVLPRRLLSSLALLSVLLRYVFWVDGRNTRRALAPEFRQTLPSGGKSRNLTLFPVARHGKTFPREGAWKTGLSAKNVFGAAKRCPPSHQGTRRL